MPCSPSPTSPPTLTTPPHPPNSPTTSSPSPTSKAAPAKPRWPSSLPKPSPPQQDTTTSSSWKSTHAAPSPPAHPATPTTPSSTSPAQPVTQDSPPNPATSTPTSPGNQKAGPPSHAYPPSPTTTTASSHPPTADDLDRIITALRSRFHVIILDTGNNDLDAAWQHAITIADHIIIPVQWDPDTLTLTQNMVRDMNHLGATHLKNRCIWVGTHAPIDLPKRSIKKSFTTALTDAGWTVHTLPADRHIASDGTITWTTLAHHHRQGHPMNHDDPSDDDLFGDTPWKNMPRHQARRHRPDKLLPTLVIILTLALITTLTWATHQTRKEPPHPPRATVTVTVTITASPHSKTPGEPPTQR